MILLYRFTSFAVALMVAGGFVLILFSWRPFLIMFLMVMVVALLLARLLLWNVRQFQFWHLLSTPLLFLLSSFGPFLLMEHRFSKIGIALLVVLLLSFFVEHVFRFIHLPIAYQPFILEHLSQLLHMLSVFFLSVLGFGLSLFLQTPLWLLALVLFPILFFMVYGTLWVGKVDPARARPYALVGAVLLTELFVVLSFLPTGFYSNAAFLALGTYMFLGLSRAQALNKLSKTVLWRYLAVFVALSAVIISTSQWL